MFTILKAVSVSALTAYLLFSEIGNWFSNLCRRYSLLQSYHLCLVLVCLIALRSDLLISQIVPLLLWEGSRSCPSLACLSTRTCWRALGDHIQFFKASLSCSFFSLFWHVVSVIPIIPGISWSFLNFFLCCCVLQLFLSFCIYCPCPASVNPAFFSFQFLSFQFPHGIFKNSLTLSLSPVKDFLRCVSPDLFDVLPLCIIFWHYRFLTGIVGIKTCWTKWSRMLYWLYLFWAHLGYIWSPCLSWFFFLYFLRRSLAGIIRRLWSDKILSHHPDLNWSLMLQQNLIWHTRDFHSDYFIRVFLITIVLFEDLFSKAFSNKY